MNRGEMLTEFEQLVLLALVRLGRDAYGVTIREEIEERAGRAVSLASAYAALERMQQRGYVSSWVSEPQPVRGGRSRKYFQIEAAGALALRLSRAAMQRMWDGLEAHPDLETS